MLAVNYNLIYEYLDSIKETSATIAYGLMKYYTGNNTGDIPGVLPQPYYCKDATY